MLLPWQPDRDRIERQLDRIVVTAQALEIHLASSTEGGEGIRIGKSRHPEASGQLPNVITVPWSATTFEAFKGIVYTPSSQPGTDLRTREALLRAIAKARTWIDYLVEGRVGSLSEIALREGKVERHVRLLAALAFISPRIISEIVGGLPPSQ